MKKTTIIAATCLAVALGATAIVPRISQAEQRVKVSEDGSGVIRLRSAHGFAETIERLKADIAAKGIMFFSEIDQSKLAAGAGIALAPSTLLVFGNPPLGTLFVTANPLAGLDWPVRLLVYETGGQVWVAYTDFAWIARRHKITSREVEFKMATGVVGSITSAVAAK